LDTIVGFAGIESFIDTPVKRYSSGMYMRLAFSIAVHSEPDVLLIDEVLAVGDLAFKRASVAKMRDVAASGSTVLFVSHDLQAVASLTDRAYLLDHGRLIAAGNTGHVLREYQNRFLPSVSASGVAVLPLGVQHQSNGLNFTRVTLEDRLGRAASRFIEGDDITVRIDLSSEVSSNLFEIGISIRSNEGQTLFAWSSSKGGALRSLEKGILYVQTKLTPNSLRPGQYSISLGMTCPQADQFVEDAIRFEISESPDGLAPSIFPLPGLIHVPFEFGEIRKISS
jgi:ABC-type molybdate transport system ATPase subunit